MIADACTSALVILHSQLILPRREVRIPAFAIAENYETLWNCVNRICDKYIPTLRLEEFTHQGNVNVHLSRNSQTQTVR
jgi:hypothetical protein